LVEALCYNLEAALSVRDRVIGFPDLRNPLSRTVALGSTEPLTEMSTKNLPVEVKGGRRVRLTTSPSSVS
jgi:hypothetical protein